MQSPKTVKVIQSAKEMQCEAEKIRSAGKKIAFVPTMGALHEGHLSLIKEARKHADIVVMSIYVNPTQFGPKEDFKKYPRPLKKDLDLARSAGADIVFTPKNLYESNASTFVEELSQSQGRCGDSRSGHFRGVTTIVCKLFHIVQPHTAIFGQKDAQQCDVLERMVRDLFMPVKIVRAPIVRDANGLARSSRNAYLSEKEYATALRYAATLKSATSTKGLPIKPLEKKALTLLRKVKGIKPEYVVWKNGYLCAAVKVGKTRLIDNVPYPIKGSSSL